MHRADPDDAENVPAAQLTHALEPEEEGEEYVPAWQLTHADAASSANVPPAQTAHAVDAEAPVESENEPEGQLVHDAWPLED